MGLQGPNPFFRLVQVILGMAGQRSLSWKDLLEEVEELQSKADAASSEVSGSEKEGK